MEGVIRDIRFENAQLKSLVKELVERVEALEAKVCFLTHEEAKAKSQTKEEEMCEKIKDCIEKSSADFVENMFGTEEKEKYKKCAQNMASFLQETFGYLTEK